MSEKIESPCVRNCCLDKQDICIGCGRTLEEIKQWQALSRDVKQKILQRVALWEKPLKFK